MDAVSSLSTKSPREMAESGLQIMQKPRPQSQSSLLLQLPVELRFQVYQYLIPTEISRTLFNSPEPRRVDGPCDPAILQTCRATYGELRREWYGSVKFSLYIFPRFSSILFIGKFPSAPLPSYLPPIKQLSFLYDLTWDFDESQVRDKARIEWFVKSFINSTPRYLEHLELEFRIANPLFDLGMEWAPVPRDRTVDYFLSNLRKALFPLGNVRGMKKICHSFAVIEPTRRKTSGREVITLRLELLSAAEKFLLELEETMMGTSATADGYVESHFEDISVENVPVYKMARIPMPWIWQSMGCDSLFPEGIVLIFSPSQSRQ